MKVTIDGVEYAPIMSAPTGLPFGELIKSRRKELGYTLESLAIVMDCSKSRIWELENGECNPGRHLLNRLRLVLHIPAELLLAASNE